LWGGSIMDGAEQDFLDGLKKCFADLKDPRVVPRCDHLLLDIVAMTLLAVLCGAEDWPDIELFGQTRKEWLKTFLQLPNGIPSHDTFRRVFGALERNQFAHALFQWTQALHEATGGKLISIDGKALRRSLARKSGKAMLHLVTAWASENGLTLGQVACEEKSNEITAIPELLKLLSLKGCTVTIDAMGCQKEIAAQIREQKGHYVLALKGNQSGLQEDLQQLFVQAIDTDFAEQKHDVYETRETGHGRTDERTCHVLEIPKDHPQRAAWKDLRTVAAVTSQRTTRDQETCETRFYITSHAPRAKLLAQAIRRHWSIENGQHWVLDVTFGEDQRRQQDRNGAANFAAVRRLAVSLLRRETSNKRGAKNKRLRCALDPSYLLKVLHTAKF
jgi:predicted transposase YbfD/YdcC